MTSISYISDLHVEFSPWQSKGMGGDIRVFAGDICDQARSGTSPIQWIANQPERTPAIFVPGNHDFYGHSIPDRLAQWKHEIREFPWIHILDDSSVTIDGIHFLGGTLWSGLELWGEPSSQLALDIQRGIRDFDAIFHENQDFAEAHRMLKAMGNDAHQSNLIRWFSVHEMICRHHGTREFLERECTPDSIVITHFPPHPSGIPEKYREHRLSPYFCNNMSLIRAGNAPRIWISGHMHNEFDHTVANTRMLCNPRGYPHEWTEGDNGEGITIQI